MNAVAAKTKRWIRRIVLVVLLVPALWLLAWLAVPPILKSQLQKIASQKLGRNVTVGAIEFKPWTLEVSFNDVRIAAADGGQPQLQIARIYADAELQSILRLAPVIDAVLIESPVLKLTRSTEGHYDIEDIIAKLASGPTVPGSAAPKFALYNIVVSGGSVDFTDEPVKRVHQLRDLALQVPFLSNLDSEREVKTEPRLAFVLNGSRFDSSALSTPFSDRHQTEAQLNFKGLALAPYLGYAPPGWPVQLQAATLDATLKVAFERGATSSLNITGVIEAHGARLADAKGGELLDFDSLQLDVAELRPLEKILHLSAVSLAAPKLLVARDAAGKLNLLPASAAQSAPGTTPAASTRPIGPKSADTSGWRVQVDKLALQGGSISWHDQATQPAAVLRAVDLGLEAHALSWPMDKAATFNGSLSLQGAAVRFQGAGTDQRLTAHAELEALSLSLAAPYLAQSLEPTLDGKLSGQLDIDWKKSAQTPELGFKATRLLLADLALAKGKTSLASVGKVELTDAAVDLIRRTVTVGAFTVTQPRVQVERDSEAHWMYERWLRPPVAGAAPSANVDATPWQLSIGKLALNDGTVSYADRLSETPLVFDLTALNVQAEKIASGSALEMPLQVSGRIGAGSRADPGRFSYKGKVMLKPLSVDGRLEASAVPAHAFKTYYQELFNNVDVRRAFAGYNGTLRYVAAPDGLSLKLVGDAVLEDFRANSATLTQALGSESSNELLSWKALSLRGLQLTLAPASAPVVDVRETTLTDFFARLIVDQAGQLNLQKLTKPGAAPGAPAASAPLVVTTQRTPGGGTTTTRAPASAELMVGGDAPSAPIAPSAPVESTVPISAAASGAKPVVRFGPMSLVNGRIDFTDNFVKPNYSADLTALTGKLSAFSSTAEDGALGMADIELRGKAQQTAALEILGKINPLAKPLVLDITAKMSDLDLPPLSPYAVRYAGHGIERGKLSMEVKYQIKPDGQLTASNKLVLNQLRFGAEVPGAPNSLPVRLAVALLADRNGVIDVDLPLSGSLNDPQFSIGPLIFKGIMNLIAKAIVAPFALLTGGFGGDNAESSAIAFDAGTSALSASAKQNLDKLAKALVDRPGLKMTVIGTASLEGERDAYQRQRLLEVVHGEKRRAADLAGQSTTDVAAVTDAEYPALLLAVYKRADITKPRNLVGLSKDLPVADMEKLLLSSIPVDENAMRELAVGRSVVVRDYLLGQKIPSERLFLGAVRTTGHDAKWKPGAELILAMN